MATKTFRPPFTLPELIELKNACLQSSKLSLAKYLEHRIYVYENELAKPAYTRTPKPSIDEKLGFTEPQKDFIPESLNPVKLLEQYRKSGLSGMSSTQIYKIQMHRYENDLMSAEEERAWEKSQGA